ncbi:hypothetical protein CAEBREN_20648 [Caenorhabditis brenneri]|uniref:JmjC domain-containing protein n=1 Tax=Caenorhabditis brenneri TaxID=135651 RepID=G0N653_CAEBE|nr:hypothetical protein CAEBREN_20648 [Caenorhabditis brenneri]
MENIPTTPTKRVRKAKEMYSPSPDKPKKSSHPKPPQKAQKNLKPLAQTPRRNAPKPHDNQSFMESLRDTDGHIYPSTEHFMEKFSQGEHLLKNPEIEVKYWKNGHEFMAGIGKFDGVHLVGTKDGLGMMVPDDLDSFDAVKKYITTTAKLPVIVSGTRAEERMSITKLIKAFNTPKQKRSAIYNLLSLEFDSLGQGLRDAFSVPEFVRRKSMINKLKAKLTQKIQEIQTKMENGDEKEELKTKQSRLQTQIDTLPKYQMFLLLSMEGSFTDIHVDFSATSVYYHVVKGRKIFYVAKPTEENLRIYAEYEKTPLKEREEWIGETMTTEWQRLEIKEGQTAMIPSGFVHFVFTPEDSIVIGGNYLVEEYLEQQFELTVVEEECVKINTIQRGHMLEGFWDVMFSYTQNILIPELENGEHGLFEMGRIMQKYLKEGQNLQKKWYSLDEKKEILKKLGELVLAEPTAKRARLDD